MECSQTPWPSNKDYLQQFYGKVRSLHVPLSGSLELTHRCNLRCAHCYLGPQEVQRTMGHLEMNTEQVVSILDEITEAGCLYLLITGGDPFMRKDFSTIYRHARANGLVVTLFTNGTLINDEILELFSDMPPRCIEISLYGATAETYERVTRFKGSYERCLTGIQRLLDHNVYVRLKTVLMTLNKDEFFAIEEMTKEYGVKFHFDAAISPCLSGDKAPLELRVPPEEVISREFADEDRAQQWCDSLERSRKMSTSDTLYKCGAGVSAFHIDPYGHLQPCLMTNHPKYNLLNGTFVAGWLEVVSHIRGKKIPIDHPCGQCEKHVLCGYCPALFELEKGAEDSYSEYLCDIGHHRFEVIRNRLQGKIKNAI